MSQLKWSCHRCRFEIADREGVVYCQTWTIPQHLLAPDGEMKTIAQIIELPGPAQWHPAHVACFDAEEDQGYAWDIERLRTVPGLLEFHFHVADKNWADGTDLNQFTYDAVQRLWAEAS